jgi:putative membrane protein insertion efficiency factor
MGVFTGFKDFSLARTCSQYAYDAVKEYGFFKGFFLSIKRIGKCHPWHEGGFDPVLDKVLLVFIV